MRNVSAVFKEKKKYKKKRKERVSVSADWGHSAAEALWRHDCPRTGRRCMGWPESRQRGVGRGVQALFAET